MLMTCRFSPRRHRFAPFATTGRLLILLLCLRCTRSQRVFLSLSSSAPTSSSNVDVKAKLRSELAIELVLMSVVKHGYFTDALTLSQRSDDEDRDVGLDRFQHVMAMAAGRLLRQLRTMREIDEILTRAANDTVATVVDHRIAVDVFYEILARLVEQYADATFLSAFADARRHSESLLNTQLQNRPRRRYSAHRTPGLRPLIQRLAVDEEDVRELALCSLFLETRQQSDDEYGKRVSMTVLKVIDDGEPTSGDEMEKIFAEAVAETAHESPTLADPTGALDSLLHKLVIKMKNNSTLQSRVSTMTR